MPDYWTIRRKIGSTERSPRAPTGGRAWIAGLALAALWSAAATPTVAAQVPATATIEEAAPMARGLEVRGLEVRGQEARGQEARGQAPVWPQGEWSFGGSLGFPGVGLRPFPGAFTLGAHALYFPRGGMGLEGSLGFAPLGLGFGALTMGGRAGVTVPIRTGSILVLPSVGASVLAGGSRHGIDAGPGFFYAGLATLHVGGTRVGATVHWRHLNEQPVWLVEFGGIRLPNRERNSPRVQTP